MSDNNSDGESFQNDEENYDYEENCDYQYGSDEEKEVETDKYNIDFSANSWEYNKKKYEKEDISLFRNRWKLKEIEIRDEIAKKTKGEIIQKGLNSKELYSQSASSCILQNDLWHWMQNGYKEGIEVTPDNDDIFTWIVKIHECNPDSELNTDISCLDSLNIGYSYIEMKFNWHMNLHPYFPPFVTLVRPRFRGPMLGKIATLPCLQVNNWDPIHSPNQIFSIIKKELEKNGRIDLKSSFNSIENYKEGSYLRLEHLLVKLAMVTDTTPRVHIHTKSPVKFSTLSSSSSSSSSNRESLKEQSPYCEEKKRKIDKEKIIDVSCPYQFQLGDTMWRCSTCCLDPKVVMCDNCFKDSNHLSHLINSETVKSAGLYCNCSPTGVYFCNKHKHKSVIVKDTEIEPKPLFSSGSWAKGTGYGSGHQQGNSSWNVEQYLAAQKEKDRMQSDILSEIFEILKESRTSSSVTEISRSISISSSSSIDNEVRIFDIVEESCLVPLIIQYLVNFQLREVEIQAMYRQIFQIMYIFYDLQILNPLLLTLKNQDLSIQQLVSQNLNPILAHYQKYNKDCLIVDKTRIDEMSSIVDILDEDEKIKFLFNICKLISELKSEDLSIDVININKSDELNDNVKCEEDEYKSEMIGFQFKDVDNLPNYFYKEAAKSISGSNLKDRIKRITKELVDLNNSLPLSFSSSVFMRVVEDRIDTVQFLITGPENTPYEDGAFIFDAYFPPEYPNSPPKVNLQTTGRAQVRFNPNLYNCGKVCLSLLGTWSGNAGETWDPKISTFLQVLVSIQSLIFVPDPYFNEPGYESTINTKDGTNQSNIYNQNIRNMTIKWAMLDHLQHPSTIFGDVINTHFKLKKNKIIKRLNDEINDNSNSTVTINQTLISLLTNL